MQRLLFAAAVGLVAVSFPGHALAQARPGLIAWWPADGTFADESIYSHDALSTNAPSFGTGVFGQAFSFNGNYQYLWVYTHSNFAFGTGDFSVVLWAKPNQGAPGGSGHGIIDKDSFLDPSGSIYNGWLINTAGALGGFGVQVRNIPGSNSNARVPSEIPSGTWGHVAAVRQSGVLTLYRDGTPVASATSLEDVTNSSNLTIGALCGGCGSAQYYNGSVDDIAIFNRALTASEVVDIVASGVSACQNGVDDDGDGTIDVGADPGCADRADNTETGSGECDNGLDDDGDGFTDFPSDPGCASLLDPSENAPSLVCDNGDDDDGDGRADFPTDPGCDDVFDASEQSDALVCDNGDDDDGDGLVDYPQDDGCDSLWDATEVPPACRDGIDNDGDGLIDAPDDRGCFDANDVSEEAFAVDDPGTDPDASPGDGSCATASGTCTLTAAVQEANVTFAGDVIELPAGTFPPPPAITNDLILFGAGADSTTLDATGAPAALTLDFGTVVVEDLSLTGATLRIVDAAPYDVDFTLRRCWIHGNAVGLEGGTVEACTVSGNAVGALFVAVVVQDSTISGNEVFDQLGFFSAFDRCTIVGNTGAQGFLLQLTNSISAGNEDDCATTSGGYNLIGAADSCGLAPTDLSGTVASPLDPGLGPLGWNGGPTPTHAPIGGSPVLDAIPAASCTAPVDQRGTARPIDGDGDGLADCDIGAVERNDPVCANGTDDDGDGLIDAADPGCQEPAEDGERSEDLACDDGVDNDGDGYWDYVFDADGDGISDAPGDPACRTPAWSREHAKCQDGVDNDGVPGTDYDGGVSILGVGNGDPAGLDWQCLGRPWYDREVKKTGCGLGAELALGLPLLRALRRRRGRRA